MRSCGPMDKASDYESGDCRFESCQDQNCFVLLGKQYKYFIGIIDIDNDIQRCHYTGYQRVTVRDNV